MIAERFFRRFRGLDRAHGTYRAKSKDSSGKMKGQALTVREEVTPDLWQHHLDGEQGIGVIPITDNDTVYWGALDIDKYDIDPANVQRSAENNGLPLVVCRSKSGGAHCFLFFDEEVDAELVQSRLTEMAVFLGYPGIEIFPKQTQIEEDAVGNWLNMPYFGGAEERFGYDILGEPITDLESFIDRCDAAVISEEQLRAYSLEGETVIEDGPPCLQVLAKSGIPEGTRNNALFNFGVYAKQRFGDDWEDKLEEYNRTLLDQPLPSGEVQKLKQTLGRKEYYYKCNDQPIASVCQKSICKKRKYGVGNSTPDLQVESVQKLLTSPPLWYVTVSGKQMTLETEDLLNPDRFKRSYMSAHNQIPYTGKRADWEAYVNSILSEATEVEAPRDTDPAVALSDFVDQYLEETPAARDSRELKQGKIYYTKNGNARFRSQKFLEFLNRHGFNDTKSASKVFSTLSAERDVSSGNMKTPKGNVRYWEVTPEQVDDESYDIPDIGDEAQF